MARLMVDTGNQDVITEWGYSNEEGHLEIVKREGDVVSFLCGEDEDRMSAVYISDLPMFIKALQAAYDSKQGEKI